MDSKEQGTIEALLPPRDKGGIQNRLNSSETVVKKSRTDRDRLKGVAVVAKGLNGL